MGLFNNIKIGDIITGIAQLKANLGQGLFKLPFGPVEQTHADSENSPYCRLELFGPRRSSIALGQESNLFCTGWEIKVTDNLPSANFFNGKRFYLL